MTVSIIFNILEAIMIVLLLVPYIRQWVSEYKDNLYKAGYDACRKEMETEKNQNMIFDLVADYGKGKEK